MKLTTKLSYFSIFVLLIGLPVRVSAQAAGSDEPIVGRWEFPMGQIYTFKADGTFSAPSISGTWKSAGMNQANASALYDLYTYSQSGRLSQKPEVLTLSRGDREGHEYESGHVLRLDQQMRVKKLPDRADDDFSGNSNSRSTETRRSRSSSEVEYDGQIGGSPAVFRLTTENEKVTGTYSQRDKTYRIVGRYENAQLLLDEYTGGRLTAHIKLDPNGSGDSWRGTMYNVFPNKEQYPVTFSRVR
jgi:hypothetical protein